MRDYLAAQIERRRADVDRLEAERQALARQIDTINIELRTYTDEKEMRDVADRPVLSLNNPPRREYDTGIRKSK